MSGPAWIWYQPKKERIKGWVYVIQRKDGLCKIGHTNNLKRRLDQHRLKNKSDVHQLILTLECADRYKTETALHRHFKSQRVTGEWFSLSATDITTIASWKA